MHVMLIRHGEKPHGKVHGVTLDGRKSKQNLSPRGWQRAGALVQYFVEAQPAEIATPAAIFASRVEPGGKSRRPRRTVEPLAAWLQLPIDDRYGEHEEAQLVRRLQKQAGPSLVCWHHEGIPTIARLLAPRVDTPATWPSDRFDLIWMFKRSYDDAWRFDIRPQRLLAGDRGAPDVDD